MSVYVDSAMIPYGRMLMSHMWADTAEELHAMADVIGLMRKHYQSPDGPQERRVSFPHYDVSQAYRKKAINAGATVIDDRKEAVNSRRSIRARIIDDPGFEQTWAYARAVAA